MEEVKIIVTIAAILTICVSLAIIIICRRADKLAYHRQCIRYPYRIVETNNGRFWIQSYNPQNRTWNDYLCYPNKDSALSQYYDLFRSVVVDRVCELTQDEMKSIGCSSNNIKEIVMRTPERDKLNEELDILKNTVITPAVIDYVFTNAFITNHKKS